MTYALIRPEDTNEQTPNGETLKAINERLQDTGWALLRGFDVDLAGFSTMTESLCSHVTFDPAREQTGESTQMVNAGLGPIGLHIENGNTPVCPDLVAFYARTAAFEGSQTTICDGRAIFEAMDAKTQQRWGRKMTVQRRLDEPTWKRYLTNEHPALSDPSQITMDHIHQFQGAFPGQSFALNPDGSLDYSLEITPVRPSKMSGGHGFANAILGPSFNYEPPVYTFEDGEVVSAAEVEDLRGLAEQETTEVNWQDGDIAVLDNTRVMHGRRAIKDQNRELFIGMGRV